MKKQSDAPLIPLSFITVGKKVHLAHLGPEIEAWQQEQLTAYGLGENQPLLVLQQSPMTVIAADEIELALEHEVARHVWVRQEES